MKQSLKQILLDHWKVKEEWINGCRAEEIALAEGFKASNASRRLRELHTEGLLERELRSMASGGKSVWYKVKLRNEEPSCKVTETSRQGISSIGQEIKAILRGMRKAEPSCPSLFS